MKAVIAYALPALAISLAAGPAQAQTEASGAAVQVAQAGQTTIYRTTVRERIVTTPGKRAGAPSRRVISKSTTITAPRTVRGGERVGTRPAASQPLVVAPAASVVAPAPLALTPYQRSTLYRAIAAEPAEPAAIVTRRFDPLTATPGTVGAAIVESAEPDETVAAAPAAPVVRETVLVGQRLPAETPLYVLPQSALVAEPELASYRYAILDEQMMLVDPATGIVVASLTE